MESTGATVTSVRKSAALRVVDILQQLGPRGRALVYRGSKDYVGVCDLVSAKAERILHDHLPNVIGVYDVRAPVRWIEADVAYCLPVRVRRAKS